MTTFDVETSLDVNLLTGQEIVRVRYRERGERRWTRLFVVPDAEQTVGDLLTHGHEIAAAHSRLDRPPAQLGAQEGQT